MNDGQWRLERKTGEGSGMVTAMGGSNFEDGGRVEARIDCWTQDASGGAHPWNAEPAVETSLRRGGVMPRACFMLFSALVALILLLAGRTCARAAEDDEDEPPAGPRPSLRAGALPTAFVFDGSLRDPAWRTWADSIGNLVTIEPRVGEAPLARTVIKVLAGADGLVVGVRCYDPDPAGIVSPSTGRDADMEEEDHLILVFDTFLDGRSGYVFEVNPAGARFDGLVASRGEEVNGAWDAIWEAKTSRDSSGWCAEIRIPAGSLGFDPRLTSWGFNVQRRVTRLQETSRWSGATRDYEVFQTSHSGLLTGLPAFDLGVGLSIRPALVTRVGRAGPDAGTEQKVELSLDVTKSLGPRLLSSLTLNTDFAETEVEARQLQLTRFPLFFPEKRSFFLSGADIFEFGMGLDEGSLLPFFSRRIGLFGLSEEEQAPIPINVGGKISGRVGGTSLGAIIVGTRRVEDLSLEGEDLSLTIPRSTMGAVRIKQNVFDESTVGMIATFGDQQGRAGSWAAGADATFQTSSLLEDKNFLVGAWGMVNGREDLAGDKSAFGAAIDYPNDPIDIDFSTIRIGDGFDPSLSFVRRRGVHIWSLGMLLKPRPSWPGVRELGEQLEFKLYNQPDNRTWISYEVAAHPFDVLFTSGDRIEFAVEPQGDRPPDSFSISEGVDLPAGSYEWRRYRLGMRSAEKRPVTGQFSCEWGSYYNGDLTTLTGRLALRPWAFLTLEASGERSTGSVQVVDESDGSRPSRRIDEKLIEVRAELNASSSLQWSSVSQYDTQSGALGLNSRLRWTLAPRGDLYVVYNHNLLRRPDHAWQFVSNQLPLKIQYSWRF